MEGDYVVYVHFTEANEKTLESGKIVYTSEFSVVLVNNRVIDLFKQQKVSGLIAYLDATGNLVKNLNCLPKDGISKSTNNSSVSNKLTAIMKPCGKRHNDSRILNYVCAVQLQDINISAFEFISSCHKIEDMIRCLTEVKNYYLKNLGYIPIKLFVVDYNPGQLHTLLRVFCDTDIVSYLNDAFEGKLDPYKKPLIALCHVHVIHIIAKRTKNMKNKKLRTFILELFCLLINTNLKEEFDKIIANAIFFVSSPTITHAVDMCLKRLGKLITNDQKKVVKDVLQEKGKEKDEKENKIDDESEEEDFVDDLDESKSEVKQKKQQSTAQRFKIKSFKDYEKRETYK